MALSARDLHIIDRVKLELVSARSKFPDFNSAHEGKAVIEEEMDELWQEVKHGEMRQAREEAIQVAAMAVRFVSDLADDERRG